MIKKLLEQLTDEELNDKIVVSVQPFNGKVDRFAYTKSVIPWWVYVIGGVLYLVIGVLVFMFIQKSTKSRRTEEELIIEEQLEHLM